MSSFKSPFAVAVLSATLTASVVGSVAIAQTPTTSAGITACVAESSGHVRIVGSTSGCRSNEALTTWPDMSSVAALSNRIEALESSLRVISGQITLSWRNVGGTGDNKVGEIWIEASALEPGSTLTLVTSYPGGSNTLAIEMPVSAEGTYVGLPGPIFNYCSYTYYVVGTGRFGNEVTSNTLGNC